ncbi:MAG: hypothetical protein EAZ70_11535 [Runella slithyformis]|nr:MAG: hypothetical protein EAY79_12285 [Runella slithyformis]TAF24699.1 MAG: hypothetical protein EAZ70_11535 [Runella slithyformis]TAF49530.1 MAG: hypothetical protein EAZ63_01130 [Runella slithyformis]TAF79361.1 MAG: hypothetical protein EAZ50_11655 [Runella slithyformis]TAH06580.1 MAG: hypothetical protein EAZ14_12485 [Runella slithyformis]
MKTYLKLFILLAIVGQSCAKRKTDPTLSDLLNGTFKAKEVKEATLVVFREGAASNIIPGYSKYRITFLVTSSGRRNVKLTEYSGEVFEGTWSFDEANKLLTFNNLSPRPAAGNLAFNVDKLEKGTLILSNTKPNPKTGETLNQYSLVPE